MMQGAYTAPAGVPIPSVASVGDVVAPIAIAADNPYSSPQSAFSPGASHNTKIDKVMVASRGARLAATIIDYLCMVAVSVPAFAGLVAAQARTSASANMVFVTLALGAGLGFLALVQIFYVARDGQTIGKKLMKIRIVDHINNEVPPWPRTLILRYGLNIALRQIPFYYFVDALFIFGEQQRCLHDHIASTKVIEA